MHSFQSTAQKQHQQPTAPINSGGPAASVFFSPAYPVIQRKRTACKEEKTAQRKKDPVVQRQETQTGTPEQAPPTPPATTPVTIPGADFQLPIPDLLHPRTEPDYLSLRQPFFTRGATQLWDPNAAMGVWQYNFDFFRRLGVSPDFSATLTNLTAPLAIDSQLKFNNPTWWEITDRELNTSTLSVSLPLIQFNPDFSPVAPSWFKSIFGGGVQRKAVQRVEAGVQSSNDTAAQTENYLQKIAGGGQPLTHEENDFFGSRMGYDFSQVRLHMDSEAQQSASGINALAYTHGNNIVFGAGQYNPGTENGKLLLAHELAHVVQQGAAGAHDKNHTTIIQRIPGEGAMGIGDTDAAAEREYGDSGAPKAQTCGRPSHCPEGFCSPFRSAQLAEYYRAKNSGWILFGISKAVDSRVVPLWREHINGGSPPKNLTASFGNDFTNSPTTKTVTNKLYNKIAISLEKTYIDKFATQIIDVASLIPAAIKSLGTPNDPERMNFNIPKDIPGNLAGDIGKNQLSCPSGAQPSPFNDERTVKGTVFITRLTDSEMTVTPLLTYTVKDTIDLCPGDCGNDLEQFATIPISQWEATGISGDVPFTVEFPAPFLGNFPVPVPKKPGAP